MCTSCTSKDTRSYSCIGLHAHGPQARQTDPWLHDPESVELAQPRFGGRIEVCPTQNHPQSLHFGPGTPFIDVLLASVSVVWENMQARLACGTRGIATVLRWYLPFLQERRAPVMSLFGVNCCTKLLNSVQRCRPKSCVQLYHPLHMPACAIARSHRPGTAFRAALRARV